MSCSHLTAPYNSKKYCSDLGEHNRPETAELINGWGVIYHRDSAEPRFSLTLSNELSAYNWAVSPHPPFSSNLVPVRLLSISVVKHF